ncbi:hypothetical protein ARMGADRAFT_1037225 [Armillaria gallica]|uniref:Uncharacterized protein n=1 Tax=Armillaria gallica TaxID=47427 RepID=A0A2H3CYN2_ARMGA|nr:hypothetical protein ARMGADRAFT_1037225 [Armillaria gallica]
MPPLPKDATPHRLEIRNANPWPKCTPKPDLVLSTQIQTIPILHCQIQVLSPAPCENPSKALEDHRSDLTIRVPSLAKRGRHELSEAVEDAGSEALVILMVMKMEAELQKVTTEAGIATVKAAVSVKNVCQANVTAVQVMAQMEQSKEGELQERIAREAHEKHLQELEYVVAQTREEVTEEVEQSKEKAHKERVAWEAHEKQLRELESVLAVARTNQDRPGMGMREAPVDPALSLSYLSGSRAGEPGPTARRGREDMDMTSGEAQGRSLGARSSTVELQPGAIQLDEDIKMAGDEHKHDTDNKGGGPAKPFDQKPTAEGNCPRHGNDSNKTLDGHGGAPPSSATQTLDMHTIVAQLESMKAMWAMNTQLIMELQQEYTRRRPLHQGPMVFKQPPGIEHDLQVINIEHATYEEVESFDLVGEPKPTLQGMQVYWSNLKVKYPDIINSIAQETVVCDMYFDHLTRLKKALILFEQRAGEQEEEHEERIIQQLNAKLCCQCSNTRRTMMYENHLEICKANSKLDDSQADKAWLSIQGIVTVLKAGGMSLDEKDSMPMEIIELGIQGTNALGKEGGLVVEGQYRESQQHPPDSRRPIKGVAHHCFGGHHSLATTFDTQCLAPEGSLCSCPSMNQGMNGQQIAITFSQDILQDIKRRGSVGLLECMAPVGLPPLIIQTPAVKSLQLQHKEASVPGKANLTVTYEKSDGRTQGNVPKQKRNRSSHQVERNLLRARAKHHNHILSQEVEVLKSSSQTLDAKELPFNGTGWAGKPFNRAHSSILKKAWHSSTLGLLLTGFYHITFSKEGQLPTYNMAAFMDKAQKFVAACTPFMNKDAGTNVRGNHWFCIVGHNLQNKSVPALTAWHHIPQNADAVRKYFAKGTMLWHVFQVATSIVKYEFLGIFQRYKECSDYMQSHFGIEPMFGCFFNFCINMSWPGYFKDDEKCWLVLWEEKLLLQLPPSVFLAYPSSLFYHFNLDLNGNEKPSSKHSSPLNNPWEEGEEQGSCIWFLQATMFQTSELDIPTMKAGRAAGMDVHCDYESLIDSGNFFWEQDEPEAE